MQIELIKLPVQLKVVREKQEASQTNSPLTLSFAHLYFKTLQYAPVPPFPSKTIQSVGLIYLNMDEEAFNPEDRHRYQLRLNELYQQRKAILNSLKIQVRRKRVHLDASSKEIPSQRSIEEPNIKSENNLDNPEKAEEAHPHLNTEEEEIKKAVDIQANIKERNRRVFGGLTSYLKKASVKREEEAQKVKEKLSIEDKANQRVQKETLLLSEQTRQEIEIGIKSKEKEKDENRKEIMKTENSVLRARYATYVSELEDCIFTKTQPSVAWRPHTHNDSTARLAKQAREERASRAKEMDEKIKQYNETFEFGRYRLDNEKEYYRNYLDRYFRSTQLFIGTKTTPRVMWKPAVFNAALSKLQKSSQAMMRQEAQAKLEENDAFYRKFEKELPADEHSEPDSE